MSEKSTYGSSNQVASKKNSSAHAYRSEPDHLGIYQHADNNATILKYAVPALADTLGAKTASYRGLIGKVGSLSRSATVFRTKADKTSYDVFIERSMDIGNRGRDIGRVTLQITMSHYHVLDEMELIAEWPLLEHTGAADGLLIDAAMQHAASASSSDEVDLDDPLLNAELGRGQADYLSELEESDDETMAAALLGTEVSRYVERRLRLTTGIRPSLTYCAGYETDEDSYALKLDDGFSMQLVGDTPAELAVMSQLNKETFVMIDSEIMQELTEALEVVGILKRSRKRKQ